MLHFKLVVCPFVNRLGANYRGHYRRATTHCRRLRVYSSESKGTISLPDGRFILEISPLVDAELVVSSVGFLPKKLGNATA